MFVVVARYKVSKRHQKRFIRESRAFFADRFRAANGFKKVTFLRNVLDPVFIDVVTEWDSRNHFLGFVRAHPKQPTWSVRVDVLERFLYESIEPQ